MNKNFFYIFFILIFLALNFLNISAQQQNQSSFDENISIANKNAMKGIYWALENIPVKKDNLTKDLIVDDKNVCTVKISREFGGIKIISTGFHNSTSVEITTYKTIEEKK